LKFVTVGRTKESGASSPCQILWRSVKPSPRYDDFSISQDGGCRNLEFFFNFEFLTVGRVKMVELLTVPNFVAIRQNRCGDVAIFSIFPRWRLSAILDL